MSDGPGSGTTTHLVRQQRARLRDSVRNEGLPLRRRDLPGSPTCDAQPSAAPPNENSNPRPSAAALRQSSLPEDPVDGASWPATQRLRPAGRAGDFMIPTWDTRERARTRLAKSPTWLQGHAAEPNVKYLMFSDHALAFPSLFTRPDATRTQRSHHQPDPLSSGPRHLSTYRRSPPLPEHESPQS